MEYLSQLVTSEDTIETWNIKRADILKRVMGIVGESPGERVPPEVEVIDEVDCGKYLRRKITYAVETDERIPAYILIPKGITESVPTILCLHGTSVDGKDLPVGIKRPKPGRDYAHELAQRGYVTFSIDDVVMGERGKGIKGFDTSGFYKRHPGWSVVGKMVWDYGCALDYLTSLDYVDSSKVGSIGHSLGATTILFLAALDKRITVSVASCGWGSWCEEDPYRKRLVEPKHGYIRLLKLRPIFLANKPAPFCLHELIALIAPRALLRISAYTDPYVARPDITAESSYKANEVYKLLNAEKNFSQYFHGDEHNFCPVTRVLTYAWFDEHFGYGSKDE